jgi:DNA polymerase-3 subunit gamma/tau
VPAAATSALLVTDSEHWLALVAELSQSGALKGAARALAEHAGFLGHTGGVLRLSLESAHEPLCSDRLVLQLEEALAQRLGGVVRVRFEIGAAGGDTAQMRQSRQRDARQAAAEREFVADPMIQQLVQVHGAHIVPDSIRPLDS